MKNQRKIKRRGFTLVELLVVIAIIAALAALTTPAVFSAMRRADMATDTNNLGQIFKSMTIFAMDNDGLFPSEELAEEYDISGSESSNDFFKQIFAADLLESDSEKLFWSKTARNVSSQRPPDGITTENGNFDEQATLEIGDVSYAYIPEQSNTDNGSRPLVFDTPLNNSGTEFDPDRRDGKALVLRLGGSVKGEKLDRKTNRIEDGKGDDILSVNSEVWGSLNDIEIAYPEVR